MSVVPWNQNNGLTLFCWEHPFNISPLEGTYFTTNLLENYRYATQRRRKSVILLLLTCYHHSKKEFADKKWKLLTTNKFIFEEGLDNWKILLSLNLVPLGKL